MGSVAVSVVIVDMQFGRNLPSFHRGVQKTLSSEVE